MATRRARFAVAAAAAEAARAAEAAGAAAAGAAAERREKDCRRAKNKRECAEANLDYEQDAKMRGLDELWYDAHWGAASTTAAATTTTTATSSCSPPGCRISSRDFGPFFL